MTDDDDSNDARTILDQLRVIRARGHQLAEQLSAPDFFNKLAERDDDSLMHRLNRMGEALINLVLSNLADEDLHDFMDSSRGLKTRVYVLDQSSHRERRVHWKSPYMERLHLATERGLPDDWGQFLYAVARVRNEYSHKLELMDHRILDVIARSFPEETGINLIDALMFELHNTVSSFSFEPVDVSRDNCGHYAGFRGQHVVRKLSYSAHELIAQRDQPSPRWQDDEVEGGIDFEIKAGIIHGMQTIVATFAHALRGTRGEA